MGITKGMSRLAIAAAFAACAAFALAPAAAAADAGIRGRVVNGTTGERVGGLEVTLHLYSDQSELGTTTTTAGDDGDFSFPAPAAGVASFQLSATFRGSEYRTPTFSATDRPDAPVTLQVFEPTSDPASVKLASWVVWVDREGTGAAVQHSLTWRNDGDRAYVGQATDGGEPVVAEVPLAPGATNFQFLGLFLDTPGSVRGATFVDGAALAPGRSEATIRYTTKTLSSLTLPVTFPTDSLRVFVPADIEVSTAELTPAGQTTESGVTYRIYAATGLEKGDRVRVGLSGLVATASSPLPVILIGSLIVVAMGVIVVWRLGRVDRSASGRRGTRPVARRSAARVGKGAAPARGSNGRRQRRSRPARIPTGDGGGRPSDADEDEDVELLIDEIAALDLSFERGLLDERTYRALRTSAKRRLLRSRDAATRGSRR